MDVPTVQRLKLAALLIGIALLAYGIRADNETVRLSAILVLVVGLVLRMAAARKRDQA